MEILILLLIVYYLFLYKISKNFIFKNIILIKYKFFYFFFFILFFFLYFITRFNYQIYKFIIILQKISVIYYFIMPIMIGGFGNWLIKTYAMKKINVFFNNIILNLVKNYNKLAFVMFILFFYINVPDIIHCDNIKTKECDYIYLSKEKNLVYIPCTHPLASFCQLKRFNDLEKEIYKNYQHFIYQQKFFYNKVREKIKNIDQKKIFFKANNFPSVWNVIFFELFLEEKIKKFPRFLSQRKIKNKIQLIIKAIFKRKKWDKRGKLT